MRVDEEVTTRDNGHIVVVYGVPWNFGGHSDQAAAEVAAEMARFIVRESQKRAQEAQEEQRA